jgi:hypothetical protein
MGRKYKRHRCRLEFKYNIPVKPNKRIKPSSVYHAPVEIALSEEDKVVYVYERDLKGEVVEVVNVSYQLLVKGNWITILRFDSEHGFLHGHMRVSLDNSDEVLFTAGVKKKGDPHVWLTWAVEYTKEKYISYKRGFLKRSHLDNQRR